MSNGSIWTNEEIEYLKKNYSTKTNKELAQDLNRSKSAVDIKLNKLGIQKSKYYYNSNYFETIDSQEKAYWLGFIYADGYITINNYNKSCELAIQLQSSDGNHLKKFNKSLQGNVEVEFFSKKSNFNNKTYDACRIRFYSQKMVYDLVNLGVTPNKSLLISFPKIDDIYIPHFIRGYFDGDGCIVKSNHNNGKSYVRADFTCGSEIFVNQLREILYKNNIKSYICRENNKPFRLVIGGMQNCDNFLNYIYNDASLYLERKYLKKLSLYKELEIEQRLPR